MDRLPTRAPLFALAAVIVFLLLGLTGVTVYGSAHAQQIFPGVRVGDVEVGGMTRDAALAKLRPWLGERTNRAITVRGPDLLRNVTAADLGATFDAAAAVETAFEVGRSGGFLDNTTTQVQSLVSGHRIEAPGLRIDRAKLADAVASWAAAIDRPVKDTQIKITEGLTVAVTPSVVGRRLDQTAAAVAVERALASGADAIDLPVAETAPKVTEKDVEEARARVSKMLSGPVSLQFGDKRWGLSQKEIAEMVTIEQKPGVPTPVVTLAEDTLKKLVDKIAAEVDQPKVNARFDWNGGNPRPLRAGQDGRKVDREKAFSALMSALTSDSRTLPLPVQVDRATGSNIDPATLALKEKIESAATSFAGSVSEKQHNIRTAASRLNGVLLAPGDVFSFNRELGPTTLKSGFQVGFGIAIANGEMQTVPSVAGGICQVATTLLHAVFHAGYQIEERYPHAYWIQSYGHPPKGMVGLDATVDDPYLDFKFKNNTDDYLLIQAGVQGTTLEFALYGTKPAWRVEIDPPAITNVVKADPAPVRQEEPTWPVGRELWVERATDGMDVVITRRVIEGSDVRTINLKSRYAPSRNVLMVGVKPPEPTAATGTPAPTAAATPSPGAPQAAPAKPSPTPADRPPPTPTPAPARSTSAPAPTKPAATATPPRKP